MRRLPPLALLLLTLLPATAFAHALRVVCVLRGDKVKVESFYTDETLAAKAKVQVVNAAEKIVVSGETDERGRWTFDTPMPGKYEVRVDAGAGHRARRTINVSSALAVEAPTERVPIDPVEEKTVSDEPTRAELTRTPWEKLLIGFGVIVGLSGAFLLASMRKKNGKANGSP
jgi:nickel transport protein